MSFRRLGEIMPQTLEGMGLLHRLRTMRALRAWPAAAGQSSPELASASRALDLQGGVLTVRVPDSRLAALLERCNPEIVRALNAVLGEAAVERVVAVA